MFARTSALSRRGGPCLLRGTAYHTRSEFIRFYDEALRVGGDDTIDASVPRPAEASRVRATLPLSSHALLAREYERHGGGVRLGRILEVSP